MRKLNGMVLCTLLLAAGCGKAVSESQTPTAIAVAPGGPAIPDQSNTSVPPTPSSTPVCKDKIHWKIHQTCQAPRYEAKTSWVLNGCTDAAPETFRVTVDGKPVSSSFDPSTGTLHLPAAEAGGPNSTIEVTACRAG